MSAVFLKVVNLSIMASWLILVVILVRFLLKKAPKWISCVLWALVAVRLVCPFSLESNLSLIPDIIGNGSIVEQWTDQWIGDPYYIYKGDYVWDAPHEGDTVSGFGRISTDNAPSYTDDGDGYWEYIPQKTVGSTVVPILSYIWLAGIAAFLLYALISCIKLKKIVGASIPVRDNILACDEVKSPFILGIIKPLIYIPSSMEGETLDYVITHESAHIQRRDHWWKPFGFLLLAVYWFNPLCWLAYVLLCRDIEIACDEKVIRELDNNDKAAYSQALLNCSFPRRRIAACPLAFGEVGVKERVKTVLNYKKPAFWIIIAAIAACAVVAVCFLTNPKATEPDLSFMNYENACSLVADVTDVDTVYYPPTKKDEDGQISIGYVNGNDLAKYLDLVSWQKCKAPQEGLPSPGSIVFYIEDGYRIAVYQKPHRAMVTYGDEVRYYKTHGGDYDNAIKLFRKWSLNSAAMKWFDSLHGDEMIWDGNRQSTLDEFPDVTFHWSSEKVEAVTDKETITLYTGMPIWSVYFCDLNGDGKPEVCSSISLGSGMIDNRIIVADYANKAVYELSDRGHYDYILTCQNGQLLAEKRAYMRDEVLDSGRLVLRSVIGTGGASIPMLMIEQSELPNETGADLATSLVAISGKNAVPVVVFPVGASLSDVKDSIHWLDIAPGPDDTVPFIISCDGYEQRGIYSVYDAETMESLDYFHPSGLAPQTYLFQNAEYGHDYIVTLCNDPGDLLCFGARISSRSFSFADMNSDDAYAKTIAKTDEVCTFKLDATRLGNDVDTIVYESERGNIVLSEIEKKASNQIELKFCAYGAAGIENATIMTACAYKDAFLQSPITVEPSDGIITKYSYMTTEFEEFGNCFSMIVFFENSTMEEMDAITVTLHDLYLVEFDLI